MSQTARRFSPTFDARIEFGSVSTGTDKNGAKYGKSVCLIVRADGTTYERTVMAFGKAYADVASKFRKGRKVTLQVRFDGGVVKIAGPAKGDAIKTVARLTPAANAAEVPAAAVEPLPAIEEAAAMSAELPYVVPGPGPFVLFTDPFDSQAGIDFGDNGTVLITNGVLTTDQNGMAAIDGGLVTIPEALVDVAKEMLFGDQIQLAGMAITVDDGYRYVSLISSDQAIHFDTAA